MHGSSRVAGHRRAFTLIEMLVVIAIIVVLMGLLLAGVSAVRAHARRVVAKTEVAHIAAAWRHYYSEYQRWPGMATDEVPLRIEGPVAEVLGGGVLGPDNPRRMRFCRFNRFNVSSNPISPWGHTELTDAETDEDHYYYVMFDTDFNNVIEATVSDPADRGWDAPLAEDVKDSVIVWTVNPDAEDDKADYSYIIGSWNE
jgi:prepilin-type N-terminal cleavage/methylation domain-containing protein